ncbi:hypothetical protein BKM14_19495 [Pseudomonas syringae pv. syringae]|nr:hypothetical protein BKM14_19495 [Pseudomonas syringae pv. syringae]
MLGTFFDWDAVAYDLWGKKLICHDDYLERLRAKTLEINLRPNPSPMGNLIRAIRRLILWQLVPGEKLICFIDEHLDEDALGYLQKKEEELFCHCVSTRWKTADEAKSFLFQKKKADVFQLDLFQMKRRDSIFR